MAYADLREVHQLAQDLITGADIVETKTILVMSKAGLDVAARGQQFAPVRTGNLRASIGVDVHSEPGMCGFEAGPTAEYGDYVEQGTHGPYLIHNAFGWGITVEHPGEAAQPYMSPAFDMVEPGAVEALADVGASILNPGAGVVGGLL